MLFREAGRSDAPTLLLLHGSGLSWWSWEAVIAALGTDYHLILPIIDGHGEDGWEEFHSIPRSAEHVLRYVEEHCGGHLFAIGGLSLGAQIAVDALARCPDLADHAVLESALVEPKKNTRWIAPTYRLCYGLLRQKWFARLQARSLCVPPALFERYYRDSIRMTLPSLTNIALSNASYPLHPSLAKVTAKTLLLAGEREIPAIRRSAAALQQTIPGSTLYLAPGLKHGQLSLQQPETYAALLRQQFEK